MDTQHAKAFQMCGWDIRTNQKSSPGDNTFQHTSTSTKSCANHAHATQTTGYAMMATSYRKRNKKFKRNGHNKIGKYKSAYKLFFSERYAHAKQQAMKANPLFSFGEVSKIVAALWASCSENEKNHYRRRILEEKAEILKIREAGINTPSAKTKIDNNIGDGSKNESNKILTLAITSQEGRKNFPSMDFDL